MDTEQPHVELSAPYLQSCHERYGLHPLFNAFIVALLVAALIGLAILANT